MFLRSVLVVLSVLVGLSGCTSEVEEAEKTTPVVSEVEDAASIMVYCGAGMRKPMDEIGEVFQEKYGTAIVYNYTGSGAQLSQIELTHQGDAFMPGADFYLDTAIEKGFIDFWQNVAYHIPVITVPKGNPAGITSLEDLAGPGIELVWGDPEVAAIGKTGVSILKKAGIYEGAWANVIATFPTMNEVMLQISLGQADAAINWWDTVKFSEDIDIIPIPRDQNDIKLIPIGTLIFSEYPETAVKFVDFCVSEEGKVIFEKHGFVTYPDPEYEG